MSIAGLAVAAQVGVTPAVMAALANVPLWSHAQALFGQLQSAFQGGTSGSGGGGLSLNL